MSSSRLWLNPTKTDVLWLGSSQSTTKPNQHYWYPSHSSQQRLESESLHATLVLLLTPSCRCWDMWRLFAILVSTVYANSAQCSDQAARTLIQAFISSRWIIATRCSMVCPTILSEEFSPSNAAAWLLTGAGRCDHILLVLWQLHWLPVQRCVDYKLLQTSMFVFSSVWPHTSVPCRRHISGLRWSSTAATLFHRQIVCRSTNTQHICRQELRCRRATCLEQSSGPLARRGHYIQQFQAWTHDVFVLMLLPGRNGSCVNCAI